MTDWSFPVAKFNDLGTNKNFRTAVGPKSSQDGFQSGSLEILPGRSKPKDKAAKFVLVSNLLIPPIKLTSSVPFIKYLQNSACAKIQYDL